MPLSALSPSGPVSLVGLDLLNIEGLKQRNRNEHLFTAKCCGAPLQIRVAPGKIPHFVHLRTPANCDGDRAGTQEHLRLKASTAAAVSAAGWHVELEAAERDAQGVLVWRADVLAKQGRARIAFEAQLSRPDWSEMVERQSRYARHGVRGLWFVSTRKPFPATNALPVFRVSDLDRAPRVHLRGANEWPDHWEHVNGKGGFALDVFVAGALGKRLVWAPYFGRQTEATARATVFMGVSGQCNGCGRILCRPGGLTLKLSDDPSCPHIVWHRDMPPQPSTWVGALLERAKAQADPGTRVSVQALGYSNRCTFCGTQESTYVNPVGVPNHLKLELPLHDLPAARRGTREWDWLNRWVLRAVG